MSAAYGLKRMLLVMVELRRAPATRFAGGQNLSACGRDQALVLKRLPFPERLYTMGPSPEPNITVLWSEKLPLNFKEVRR